MTPLAQRLPKALPKALPDALASRLGIVWLTVVALLGLTFSLGILEIAQQQAVSDATAAVEAKLDALAWRVRAELADVTANAPRPADESLSAKEARLPRFPKGAEIFLGIGTSGPVLVRKGSAEGRGAGNSLQATSLPQLASLMEARSRDEDVLLLTTAGLTVWPAVTAEPLASLEDKAVRSLLESGLARAARVEVADGPFGLIPSPSPRGVFIRQVPNTNLVVAQRISLRGMLAPTLAPVLKMAAWGLLATLLVSVLTWKGVTATFAPFWRLIAAGERALAGESAATLDLPSWLRTQEVGRIYSLVRTAALEKRLAALERELIDERERSIATFIAALPATRGLEDCLQALGTCLGSLEAARPGATASEIQFRIQEEDTDSWEEQDNGAFLEVCKLSGAQGKRRLVAFRSDGRAFDHATPRMAESLGVLVRARLRSFDTAS
ncbi:MAG: hypothetical protein IOD12_00850 [Silvanigrellales bacterium]|nr:hypothetical protein [Silvanigrellales bacterium]